MKPNTACLDISTRLIFSVMLAVWVQAAQAEVRVWESTLTLPTYEEGQPDPNPPFDIFATSRFNYPYTLRENLTNRREEHAWRAVYLENEYLKCSVLPDIGGHLYTCVDKISGQPMFYANPSIKKAQIGYRGAWAAFGIEFNFPVSHNWASMSPVDFAYSKHDDGSASVTVGNIDRVYGMEWTVELVLHPHSTVLEERVSLNNRSDVRRRFYWWNNAGVEVWDDSHIFYPMRYAASHGFTEVQTWPVDASGADLSIIQNQTKGPVSLFVHGSREPFMGVWHPKTKTGVVHFADYGDLPAKKIWSWGVDADGLDWRRALSDNDSAYVEVQAGLFRNQETYAFLEPRQTIRFSEFWMPVRGIGGIARANLAGVLNLSRRDNNLIAGFNANRPIAGASVRILDGNRALVAEKIDLDPAHTWSKEIPLPDVQRKYTFELHDNDGALLLRQTEGEYNWTPASEIHVGPQPSYRMPVAEKRTEDDWIQLGKNEELNGNLLRALDVYRQGLKKFTDSFGLGKAAGRLEASFLLYDEAVPHLEAAQRRDTPDPEIAYYLGIAYDGLGEAGKALTSYETAQRLPSFHAAASLRLGELSARKGDLKKAERYLAESLRTAPDDLRTAEELVALQRASGLDDPARSLARNWLSRFPSSYFLREQLGQPDMPHLAADPYRVLNIAAEYIRLGLYKPALEVLSREYPAVPSDESEPGSVLPQNHPLVAYFRGYCHEKLGQSGASDYAAASRLSTAYVFPDGAETLAVLYAAIRANGHDATARYLLGTFNFSRGLTDAALGEWELAREVNPKIPVLQASTGLALLRIKKEPERALAAFREGASSDPRNDEVYLGMDQALSVLARPARERVAALERYPVLADMPSALVYELALNRAESGDYDGAIALFRNRFFPREEGGTNVRQVWIEVRLQQALALADSGHCDAAVSAGQHLGDEVPGLPFTRDGLEPMVTSPRTEYLLGAMESKCGQSGQAAGRFQRASQARDSAGLVWAKAAAKKLNGFDEGRWRKLFENALAGSQAQAEATSWSLYLSGLMELELGRKQSADTAFREALLLPDRLLAYHLIRLARAGRVP
jgi:tetratricopeptide (TPR) repeat protein